MISSKEFNKKVKAVLDADLREYATSNLSGVCTHHSTEHITIQKIVCMECAFFKGAISAFKFLMKDIDRVSTESE